MIGGSNATCLRRMAVNGAMVRAYQVDAEYKSGIFIQCI